MGWFTWNRNGAKNTKESGSSPEGRSGRRRRDCLEMINTVTNLLRVLGVLAVRLFLRRLMDWQCWPQGAISHAGWVGGSGVGLGRRVMWGRNRRRAVRWITPTSRLSVARYDSVSSFPLGRERGSPFRASGGGATTRFRPDSLA